MDWNWTAPEGINTLIRIAADDLGRAYVLAWEYAFSEDSRLLVFNPQGVLEAEHVISVPYMPPVGCEASATARALAISPGGDVLVGGQVLGDDPSGGDNAECWDYDEPFLMAMDLNGKMLWSIDESVWPVSAPVFERVQFVRGDSEGALGITGRAPFAVRVDPLGTVVGTRDLGLSHDFFIGASNSLGEIALAGMSVTGPDFAGDIAVTKLSTTLTVDWEAYINSTLPDGSPTDDIWGNAIFMEDGAVLVLGIVAGQLPGSPGTGGRDLVVIRISAEGVVDY
jgi:hypothetical protein